MLERFLTQPQQSAGDGDLDYLLDRLDRLTAEEAAASQAVAYEELRGAA